MSDLKKEQQWIEQIVKFWIKEQGYCEVSKEQVKGNFPSFSGEEFDEKLYRFAKNLDLDVQYNEKEELYVFTQMS